MRNLELKRPICFFDLETTGVDKTKDRIVSIAALKIFPDGTKHDYYQVLNPGIEISDEASKIHGITNEMVKDNPTFAEVADVIRGVFSNADIAGFNSNYFDVPLLSMEFARICISFPDPGVQLIDVGNIFKIKNPRTLGAAYKFYTGKDLDGAHDAKVDIEATYEVFVAQLQSHEDLPLSINDLALFSCHGHKFLDIDQKFVINEKGQAIFNFGKNKGNPVGTDINYLGWMIDKGDFLPNTKEWARKLYDIAIRRNSSFQEDLLF